MFLWKRKIIGYCLTFYRIGESFSITDPCIYSTTNALFFLKQGAILYLFSISTRNHKKQNIKPSVYMVSFTFASFAA